MVGPSGVSKVYQKSLEPFSNKSKKKEVHSIKWHFRLRITLIGLNYINASTVLYIKFH